MKLFKALLPVLILLLLIPVVLLFFNTSSKQGTVNIEHAPATLFGFGNDQIGTAIENYLVTQQQFSWKTVENSQNFCAVDNLSPETELFPIYVWVRCGEYIAEDGGVKEISGSSGPVKINYPNELSFYDLSKFSFEAPRDGAHYPEDIKTIFPEEVQGRIADYEAMLLTNKLEEKAVEYFTKN